jgi:PKD repeat protein
VTLWVAGMDVGWGQGSFCGEFSPHQATGTDPDLIYYDRFGNSYDIVPAGQNFPSSTSVQAGYFNLNFSNQFSTAEKNVITAVFNNLALFVIQRSHNTECGDPVGNSLVYIDLIKEEDPNMNADALAAASPMYAAAEPCSGSTRRLRQNQVYRAINGINGIDGAPDGQIVVNSNYDADFFTDYPNNVIAGKYDLYTIILHEALHLLAFHPTLDLNLNYFTEYDLLLKNDNNQFYVKNQCNNACYSSSYMPCGTSCNHHVGLSNVVTSSDNVAHLKDENHVMFPGLAKGHQRREMSAEEKQVLCDIGYLTSSCNNSNFGVVHQNSDHQNVFQSCTPYGNNSDGSELCCPNIFTFCGTHAVIPFSDLLCFAHSNTNISILSIEDASDFLSTSLNINISNNTLDIEPIFPNINFVEDKYVFAVNYQYTKSDGQCVVFSRNFFIYFDRSCFCEFEASNECSNVLCYYNFNNLVSGIENDAPIPYFGNPFYFENTGVGCNSQGPAVYDDPIQGKVISCIDINNSVVFRLNNSPFNGCLLEMNMKVKTNEYSSVIEIWGSEYPPCDINDKGISIFCGEPTTCNDGTVFNSTCLGEISNFTLPNQFSNVSFIINQANHDMPINYIFLINKFQGFAFDDISVKVVNCATSADFTATLDPCDKVTVVPSTPNTHQNHVWNFGDGSTSILANPPVHTYATDGNKTITHTVTDNCGNTNVSTQIITVNCANGGSACMANLPSEYIRLNCGGGTNISTFVNSGVLDVSQLPSGFTDLSNLDIAVTGKLIIDIPVNAFNTDFVFGEGAEMEVRNYRSNFTFSTFKGCDKMWRGIRFEPIVNAGGSGPGGPGPVGGELPKYNFSNNSMVSGARRALTVNEGTNIQISYNVFENNLIGLESHNAVINLLRGNIFRGNGVLLPTYSGIETPVLISTPSTNWTGINLVGQQKLLGIGSSLPIGTIISNQFLNMRNGIVADNSKFEVVRAKFENINPGNFSAPIEGYCINATNCSKIKSDNCIYLNSWQAIYADGLMNTMQNLTIKNNVFENILPATSDFDGATVTLKNYNGGSLVIDYNTVLNCSNPFRISSLKDYTQFTITKAGPSIQLPSGAWTADGMIFTGTAFSITGCKSNIWATVNINTMTSSNYASAISLNDCTKFMFGLNNIMLTGLASTSSRAGLFLTMCNDIELRGVNVHYTGVQATFNNLGFDISSSNNVFYCSNHIEGASTAMRLSGVNMTARYRQNVHEDSKLRAMLLTSSSNMGPQFYGSTSTPPVPTAAYGNLFIGNDDVLNQGSADLSKFRIDNDDATFGTYNPEDAPSDWFASPQILIDGTPDNPLCNVDEYQGDYPWVCGVPLMIEALESDIEGVLEGTVYEDQSTWSAQNFVYDYVQKYPQLATVSSSIGTFYNNPTPVLYQYQQIEDKIRDLYLLTSSESLQMTNYSLQYDAFNQQLDSMATIMSNGGVVSSINYLSAMTNLNSAVMSMRAIDSIIRVRAIFKANNIVPLVSNLATPFDFLHTYKAITQIYLASVVNGVHSLSQAQINQVNSIAMLCPELYGRAVSIAHLLRASLGLKPILSAHCDVIIPRSKPFSVYHNSKLVNVHPNPSTTYWQVQPSQSDPSLALRMELFAADGSKISDEWYDSQQNNIEIGSQSLPAGLYFLYVSDEIGNKQYLKLIKMR